MSLQEMAGQPRPEQARQGKAQRIFPWLQGRITESWNRLSRAFREYSQRMDIVSADWEACAVQRNYRAIKVGPTIPGARH